jgi:hypothetical protein
MSKYKIIQMICWLIVFIVFVGLAIWFVLGSHLNIVSGFSLQNLRGPYEEEGRYSIETKDVGSLDIDWTAGVVTVTPYEGNVIELVEYAQRDLEENEKLVYSADGGTLSVDYCEKQVRFLDPMPSKKLEVFVPADLATNLDDFILDGVSAEINVNNLKADYFHAKTVSGEGQLTGIEAEELEISSTSGSMEVQKSDAPLTTVKTVSGSISVDEVTMKSLKLHTVSGEMTFTGSFEELTAESTSGEITITDLSVPKAFDIKSVSGEVKLTMPAFDNFDLYSKTVSGDLHSEIPVISKEDSNSSYRIKTTSGDIEINELK